MPNCLGTSKDDGGIFTENIGLLEDLSSKCPLEDGYAVFEAKSLLSLVTDDYFSAQPI